MDKLCKPHPLRVTLNNEVHARPPAALGCPARLTSLTLYFDHGADAQREALAELARRMGCPPPQPGQVAYTGVGPQLTIRWSLHTEFARYTLILDGAGDADFAATALDLLPRDWLVDLPGELLVALHAVLLTDQALHSRDAQYVAQRWFEGGELIGAEIGEGEGVVYTDLRLHADPRLADGFSRYVVIDHGMAPFERGRMLQRLFEIETYRMLALLALPIAKQQMQCLDELSGKLRGITERMNRQSGNDAGLLAELTALATEVENLVAQSQYRFSAARAYYELVARRIAELRERRLPDLQPFQEFMAHRLAPAMNTCDTVTGRQDRITARIQRASALLRTRVEVQHEEQNRALLASMDRRAALQLRLQQTVEGLSVGVLTYYAVGLFGYVLKALKAAGVHVDPELLTGLAIPVIASLVWLGVRRAKRGLGHG